MSRCITSLMSFVALGSPASASPVVGPITNPANGHDYYLLEGATWTAAEAEAVSLGGHLVTINDAAEHDWIYTTGLGSAHRWIGLTDSAQEGSWVWISGEPVTYTRWLSGEPNNLGGVEDYAETDRNGWNDVPNNGYGIEHQGIVEVIPDRDGDGVPDSIDNCPAHPNQDQNDCDGDGIGDVCAIADGASEDCNTNGVPDECEPDADGDMVPDGCDICPDGDDTIDTDGDLTPDDCDGCPNDPDKTEPGDCGCGFDESSCIPLLSGNVEAVGSRFMKFSLSNPMPGTAKPTAILVTSSLDSCPNYFVRPDGSLGLDPVFLSADDWNNGDGKHVSGPYITPETEFAFQTAVVDGPGLQFSEPPVADTTWALGDINNDTFVNVADVQILVNLIQCYDNVTHQYVCENSYTVLYTPQNADQWGMGDCAPHGFLNVQDVQIIQSVMQMGPDPSNYNDLLVNFPDCSQDPCAIN